MLGWALNEEENLGEYVRRAEAFLSSVSDDYELILIDDGSTDRTWALANELQSSRPWLTVLKNDRNRGPGYCYRRGIGAASKEYFMAQTVDWAYDIDAFRPVMDRLRRYDILQGVRPGEFSLERAAPPFRQPLQGHRLADQLHADPRAVPAAVRRFPERHRVSDAAWRRRCSSNRKVRSRIPK